MTSSLAKMCSKSLNCAMKSYYYIPLWNQVRHSRYSPIYLKPTFRKEDLAEELDDNDPRRFQPIKAPENEQTSFCTYEPLVARFIRLIMKEGKKDRAKRIVYSTFENVKHIQLEKFHKAQTDFEKESIELDPKKIFHKAVENTKPLLQLQRVKRGGVMYQVPIPVPPNTQIFQAMKWLIASSNEKDRKTRVWDKMAVELIDASNNEGKSVRKKQDLHRICEANRAFAHFRW